MGDFKVDHDEKCPKCGAFVKMGLWQADEGLEALGDPNGRD